MGQTPPPYYAGAPKKSNTTTVVFIVLGVCAVCCILGALALGGAGWFAFNKGKGLIGCAMGFDEARQATLAYAEAHKGMLPKAETWQDDITPYFVKIAEKQAGERKMLNGFEPTGEWRCQNADGPVTGIAFNKDLAGKKLADIQDRESTILFFETPKVGKNLSEPYKRRSDDDSPKIMGQIRGWIRQPIVGDPLMKDDSPIHMKSDRT